MDISENNNPDFISLYVTSAPDVEVKISSDYKNAEVEKMWPSNTKYRIIKPFLKKWELIAEFEHNGDPEKITLGDVQIFQDGIFNSLSVTNANK